MLNEKEKKALEELFNALYDNREFGQKLKSVFQKLKSVFQVIRVRFIAS